jgi:uncharacterized protein (DUF2147 family)
VRRRVIVLGLLMLSAPRVMAQAATPVGVWRTFDDEDGSETGAIEIVVQDGVLSGRLIRILNPAHAGDICTGCKDDRKGQAMLGLQLIRKVRPVGDRWSGEILDPKSGRIYRVELRLGEGGRKLYVRGYIGVTLLGRTETWVRE